MKIPKALPRSHLRIGRSRTGLGLFAVKPIRKRAIIVFYTGKLYRTKDTEGMEDRNRYLYEINSRWTVDGSLRSNLGRYANHSCRPNAESDTRGKKIFLRALRRIRAGEEIVYHYGRDYLVNWLGGRKKCLCRSCIRLRAKQRKEARKRKRVNKRTGVRAKK